MACPSPMREEMFRWSFPAKSIPDPQTVSEVHGRNHRLGSAESAYLVHLYEEDPGFVRNLNGMFHGLVIDRARKLINLFNDRFGMHRLHYHQSDAGFYFATEAKAILAVKPELRVCDPRSLGEFVSCSCILEDRTIFKGIQVLPAAASWTFRNARLESKATYFSPSEWENQTPLEPEPYYQELRSVLTTALPRYFSGVRSAWESP